MIIDEAKQHMNRPRRKRRMADMFVGLTLLAALFAVIIGHVEQKHVDVETYNDRAVVSWPSQLSADKENTQPENDLTIVASDTLPVPISSAEENETPATSSSDVNAATLLDETSSSSDDVLFASHTPLRFSDVTTKSYQNKDLGFVMALPSDWSVLDEHPDKVEFSNQTFPFTARLEDVIATPDAMWISVTKPCDAMEATSTRFSPNSGTDTPIFEETVCIPPFLTVLGLRADTPYTLEREFFLYSVARTLYPIVR